MLYENELLASQTHTNVRTKYTKRYKNTNKNMDELKTHKIHKYTHICVLW